MKNLFKKRTTVVQVADESARHFAKTIVGISESDYINVYNSIVREYDAAKSRQKKPDAAPTEYMRGLSKAIQLLDIIKPYKLEVQ